MAPAPDQPLPPLIKIDINKRTRKHITQEMTDCILQIASERQPDLWLAFSEEHRHKVLLAGTVQVPRVAHLPLIHRKNSNFFEPDKIVILHKLIFYRLIRGAFVTLPRRKGPVPGPQPGPPVRLGFPVWPPQ